MNPNANRIDIRAYAGGGELGNIAIDAEWRDHEPIAADGGVDGVTVPLAVRYRVDEGNPLAYRA